MNRNRARKCRAAIYQIEALDDRTLLNAAVAAPPPAASPTRGPDIKPLESEIRNLERQFMNRTHALRTESVDRTSRIESRLRVTINRDQALVDKALAANNNAAQSSLATANTKFTVESNNLADSLSSEVIGLNTMFQNQVSSLAGRAAAMDPQLSSVAAALAAGAQASGAQLVNNVTTGLSAASRAFQLGFRALNGAAGTSGNVLNVSGTPSLTIVTPTRVGTTSVGTTGTATTSAATTTAGTTTIGFIPSDTQVFNNAFTQAFSAFNSAITGIASTLQTDFSSFANQISTTASPTTVGIVPSETMTFNNAFTQAFSSINSTTAGITTTLQKDFASLVNGTSAFTTPTTVIGVTTPTTAIGTPTPTTTPLGVTTTTSSGASLTSTATGTSAGISFSGGNGSSL